MIGGLYNPKTYLTTMEAIKERLAWIHPLTWPLWIAIGVLWILAHLPFRLQRRLGHGIGKITYYCSPKMRHITETNLRLCFPERSPAEITALTKQNFHSLGMGLIETAMAWWLSDRELAKCKVTLHGTENLEIALARKKGALMISPHFGSLEMIGRMVGHRYPFAAMYRPHKIKLFAAIQARYREKYRLKYFARHQMRAVFQAFRDNLLVWFAYDIDAGPKSSVFAPFFGIQTASLTSASRLVEMTDTLIVPMLYYRRDDCWGYDVYFEPVVANIPGASLEDDATRLNAVLEAAIRKKPEQYVWQYKRFKTRPAGEKRFY